MNNIASEIISAFGGLTKTAKALKISSPSTIHYWVKKGKIPEWRYDQIYKATIQNNIKLKPDLAQLFKKG